ncbi:hypothetical protein JVU11DRAFT_3391 [Chiua virens]|nr:hypothetical protein JVU11DRAFT_3391 [Chiua virens]
MSSTSRSSVDSLRDPPPDVPGLSSTDSTSRLILLPNTDDRDPLQEYSTDDEDEDEDEESQSGINQLPVQPLSPSVVFLYLLSPYLRLGAIYAFDLRDASLAYTLTALVVAASLSAFCRHIWFLLGRYMRKSFTEDVLLHIFSQRHRRARKDGWARYGIIIISGSFKILLAAILRRFCTPLQSARMVADPLSSQYLDFIVYFCVCALACQVTGLQDYRSLTFACTTTMTLPLSASLIAGTPLLSPASRNARTRSFELLNVFATILAALLLLPLVIMAAPHRAPATKVTSDNLVHALRIATLSLSIPSVVVSIISLPLHGVIHRYIRTDLALSGTIVAIFALSLVPPSIANTLDDVTLFLAVSGTFLIPALTHITIHHFRRPLSIVVPHAQPSAPTTPRPSSGERSPSPSRDPLLQRKEWLLQRSRMGKRLFWDIVVWSVLLPICGCAFVWAAGRIAQ